MKITHQMSDDGPVTVKLLALLCLPPLVASILVYMMLSIAFNQNSADQQELYGESTVKQMSDYLAPYVVENDMLSLNVIAAGLSDTDYVQSVAVYDDNNTLIAQSGRQSGNTALFTHEITSQDSVVGFVRISVLAATPVGHVWLTVPVTFIVVFFLLVWRKPVAVTDWLFSRPLPETGTTTLDEDLKATLDSAEDIPDDENFEQCILVIRIRPARYLEKYFDEFFTAAASYGGIVEQTTPEELVIHFERSDGMFMAASAGLLLRELSIHLHGNMGFGGTLALIDEHPDKTRKSASYLASIADGDLIIASGEILLGNRIGLETFHHSLVDSGDLHRVSPMMDRADAIAKAEALIAGR